MPPGLRLAAAIAAVEGLALFGYGVFEVASLRSGRLTMGLSTAAFFVAYAAMLLVAAHALLLGRSWARGPLVFAQLVWLGVSWSFRGGSTTWVALVLAVAALLLLGGLLAPASLGALDDATQEDG